MGKQEKLIFKILRGTSDTNIKFEELRELLQALGFEERIRGSHHTYRKKGIEEKINIQKDGSKAKPYQVRQIRSILLRYKIVGEE
jgi:predicted RNA binding protein YcfA (HicA-like mRNA interferase family)